MNLAALFSRNMYPLHIIKCLCIDGYFYSFLNPNLLVFGPVQFVSMSS